MTTNNTIGVTCGDPAGIGVEILSKALDTFKGDFDVRVYGPDVLVADIAGRDPRVEPVSTSTGLDGVIVGRYTRQSGAASIAALQRAVSDLGSKDIAALVTGPICKVALSEAGLAWPGQTEMVAHATGTTRFAMMLAGPRLRVTLATTHLALRDVADRLTGEAVWNAVELTDVFLKNNVGIAHPNIAVLGLNPHASDQGKFGGEEAIIIEPTIRKLKTAGFNAAGPLPADTAFHRAVSGEFDAVVAMYHDQGLGPLKLIHFQDAVNITLGLPAIRCSPDHGPAFDIAGRDAADPSSMSAALNFAAASIALDSALDH
ncbi:MAG: 4-hydroxythreonine-4-phosphate dehydrogenase PdxA [Deltaproteobacteria bacterium]|nr:4-hydroxythreonine-4-phosphate dehydrogenase PdxA [Deltaproteobacteria bacterium]